MPKKDEGKSIFEGEKCEICGKPAEHYLFASFVCDCEDCIQHARERRGGPGGHQKLKMLEMGRVKKKE